MCARGGGDVEAHPLTLSCHAFMFATRWCLWTCVFTNSPSQVPPNDTADSYMEARGPCRSSSGVWVGVCVYCNGNRYFTNPVIISTTKG